MLNQAVVFPGQGSQSVGMLSTIAEKHSQIKVTFDIVSERMGYDVWNLVQDGPVEKLNQTMHTQVAMLTSDVAIYRLMQQKSGFTPTVMAGHSLGEYAALVCANAIELTDAAELVYLRGQLMQDTVPLGVGAMAAIVGLTDPQVLEVCKQASTDAEQVTPANYNAIGQVVIAGHVAAVDKAMELALNIGAMFAKIIPVSVPCHCLLLSKAAEKFSDALSNTKFQIPTISVVSNVDLSVYESVEQMRNLLKQQLYSPVRWVETIQLFKNQGVELITECGPGKVLSGLIKRIDSSIQTQQAINKL